MIDIEDLSLESECDRSICSEPLNFGEVLDNSDIAFSLGFHSASKAARVRTQSFDCPQPNLDIGWLPPNFEGDTTISESFETVSQCTLGSVTERLNALTITKQAPILSFVEFSNSMIGQQRINFYGEVPSYIHDAGIYENLVAALT